MAIKRGGQGQPDGRDSQGSPDRALYIANQALLTAQGLGIPMTLPLVDNTQLGSFWVRKGVYINAGVTSVPIQLSRNPTAFIVVDNDTGAVVYRTAADRASSTGTTLVCRATAGVSVTMLVG